MENGQVQRFKNKVCMLPRLNDICIAQITRITTRQAYATILTINESALPDGLPAVIRSQDIRQFEKDQVNMAECYLPGDLVRASILSLGDQSNYYLSTASNDLGVIFAKSIDGEPMMPSSWESMVTKSGRRQERRKVAKPIFNSTNSCQT